MDALPYVDSLFKEYLLFRGFTSTLQVFNQELAQDKAAGFQAERITELIFRKLIPELQVRELVEFLDFLNMRFYSRLDMKFESTCRRMELSILRYLLVKAVKLNRRDKVQEFFQVYGSTIMSAKDPEEWRPWFCLAYLPQPHRDPNFQVFFTSDWVEVLEVSYRNFISEVLRILPLPAVLRFNTDRLARQHLQQLVETLQAEIRALQRNQSVQPSPGLSPSTSIGPEKEGSVPIRRHFSAGKRGQSAGEQEDMDAGGQLRPEARSLSAESVFMQQKKSAFAKVRTKPDLPVVPEQEPRLTPPPPLPTQSTDSPHTSFPLSPARSHPRPAHHRREASLADWTGPEGIEPRPSAPSSNPNTPKGGPKDGIPRGANMSPSNLVDFCPLGSTVAGQDSESWTLDSREAAGGSTTSSDTPTTPSLNPTTFLNTHSHEARSLPFSSSTPLSPITTIPPAVPPIILPASSSSQALSTKAPPPIPATTPAVSSVPPLPIAGVILASKRNSNTSLAATSTSGSFSNNNPSVASNNLSGGVRNSLSGSYSSSPPSAYAILDSYVKSTQHHSPRRTEDGEGPGRSAPVPAAPASDSSSASSEASLSAEQGNTGDDSIHGSSQDLSLSSDGLRTTSTSQEPSETLLAGHPRRKKGLRNDLTMASSSLVALRCERVVRGSRWELALSHDDTFMEHCHPIMCSRISPTGANAASASTDGAVCIWTPSHATGNPARNTTLNIGASVPALTWDERADKVMLLGTCGKGIKAWHVDTKRMTADITCDPSWPDVLDIACCPTDPMFVCSSTSSALRLGTAAARGRVTLWNMRAFRKVQTFIIPGDPVATCVTYSRSGRLVATAGIGGKVNIFDTSGGRAQPERSWQVGPSSSRAFARFTDSTILTFCGGQIEEWALQGARTPIRTFDLSSVCSDMGPVVEAANCHRFAISHDQAILAATTDIGDLALVDLRHSVDEANCASPISLLKLNMAGGLCSVDWHPVEDVVLCGSVAGPILTLSFERSNL